MNLEQIKNMVNAEVLTGEEFLDREVTRAFASDLMSDVLAFGAGCDILITGLANAQAIRTAEMLDISTILFVRGKNLDEKMIELAKEKEFVVMNTKSLMYSTCGILYAKGLEGVNNEG